MGLSKQLADRSDEIILSVIVPTHNRATTLPRAIQSVLQNRRNDIELVVVDDRSTDDTSACLAKEVDHRLQTARIADVGGANRARNLGAALARGTLLAFLDSDDIFEPGRVDRLIDLFLARPDLDCTMDGFISLSWRRRSIHRLPPTPNPRRIRDMLLAHALPLTNSTVTVRKAAFMSVGGYNEALRRHQDRDLLLRLAAKHTLEFGSSMDVTKFRAANSISHPFDGYIDGLDDFVGCHNDYLQPGFAHVLRYLAARGIVKAVLQGRFVSAARELRKWSAAQHLPRGIWHAFACYRAGRHARRKLADLSQNNAA